VRLHTREGPCDGLGCKDTDTLIQQLFAKVEELEEALEENSEFNAKSTRH